MLVMSIMVAVGSEHVVQCSGEIIPLTIALAVSKTIYYILASAFF